VGQVTEVGASTAGNGDVAPPESPPPPAAPAPTASSSPPSRWGVLRHRHFRNVWIGAAISSIGGWMEFIGVQWVVAEQTTKPDWVARGYPSSSLMMGYLAAAQLLPTLVLGIAGGLVADRVNRKRLLMFTQFLLMLFAAGVATASYLGTATPWVLMWLMIGLGTTMAFNVPAWQVLTPRLVPRDELTKAITLNGIQFNLARVVGPALGGVIMAYWSPTWLFVLNTLSFLGVLIAIGGTPDSPAPPRDPRHAGHLVRDAAAFVFTNRGPLATFVAMVLFSILAAPLMRMLPLFVSQVYHAQERTYGFLFGVMGMGAVLGGLALKLVPPWYPKHHLIPLSIFLGGLSILLLSLTASLTLACIWMFFVGAFWLWSFNSSMAAMQLLVDDSMRGRVLSICNTAVFGAMPLGSVIAALIADRVGGHAADGTVSGYGVQVGVGSLAAALAIAGLVMLIFRTPEVDGLKPGESNYNKRRSLLAGITASAHRPRPLAPTPAAEPNMTDAPGV
jgi:MFS family permease